jgi:hypothetical protein
MYRRRLRDVMMGLGHDQDGERVRHDGSGQEEGRGCDGAIHLSEGLAGCILHG